MISIGLFYLLHQIVLRGRSDDKLNPGNRLQQRWDPELECSRLQKLLFKDPEDNFFSPEMTQYFRIWCPDVK